MSRKPVILLSPAAAYIRMSGRQQDKSPTEQREEISKLAGREGFRVVEWFSDEAISGDSTTDERPGLGALLTAAQAGKFTVVLAWHTNRISREEPMDAIHFYNQLRKARVDLHTCCEGAIDLEDFPKQLLLFINQKASNDYLTELAAKSLRGRIATAKAGDRAAGAAPFGMDRGEFDAAGKLIRRLRPGDKRSKGNRLRLVPSDDEQKIEAVKYAFRRFDAADLSFRQLARELQSKGYPSPGKIGWTPSHVYRLLRNCAYAGINQWGKRAGGHYYEAQKDEIIRCGKNRRFREKPDQETITSEGAHEAIVSRELFQRVHKKARPAVRKTRRMGNNRYPLSGLLFCGHCGRRMVAATATVRNARGEILHKPQRYVCGSYTTFQGPRPNQCGHHSIRAERALEWLIHKLKHVYQGPGRGELVEKITLRLSGRAETVTDVERLQRKADELDRQIGRLVTAIRTTDAAELAGELAAVKAERKAVMDELAAAKKPPRRAPATEADSVADQLGRLWQQLSTCDQTLLREVLRRFAAKIECRWNCKPGKHTFHPFAAAQVQLFDPRGLDCGMNAVLADVAAELVSFHASDAEAPGDCAEALAALLISNWEKRKPRKSREPGRGDGAPMIYQESRKAKRGANQSQADAC